MLDRAEDQRRAVLFRSSGGVLMKKISRSIVFGSLCLGVIALATDASAQTRPPVVDKMVKAHGLDGFGQVEGIRYTFNVERPGVQVARSWEWNPKTDTVTFEGKDK